MKVAGFTFIRNAEKFDYPIVEAICSILPVCDEFVVALGNSEDNTRALIENINSPKIKILSTEWNDQLRANGEVLAIETNKAFDAISPDADWCFYIQGDEVIHEKYLELLKSEMHRYLNNTEVEGLLFKYLHFYGSYNYVGDSRKWYRREIRIIRNDKKIRSYKDAQGFRFSDNKKLKVRLIDAYVYHYGWVKEPSKQQAKQKVFNRFWHNDAWMKKNIPDRTDFDYLKIDSLEKFAGTHPQVMQARIRRLNWPFKFDTRKKNLKLKNRILQWVEKKTGWRIGEYRNYQLLK